MDSSKTIFGTKLSDLVLKILYSKDRSESISSSVGKLSGSE